MKCNFLFSPHLFELPRAIVGDAIQIVVGLLQEVVGGGHIVLDGVVAAAAVAIPTARFAAATEILLAAQDEEDDGDQDENDAGEAADEDDDQRERTLHLQLDLGPDGAQLVLHDADVRPEVRLQGRSHDQRGAPAVGDVRVHDAIVGVA